MYLIKLIIINVLSIVYFFNSAIAFDDSCIDSNNFPFCLYEDSEISFKIFRYEEGEEKEEVGWHKVKFNKLEEGFEVTTNGYVQVPYLLLLEYVFQYSAKSIWINNNLQRYEGRVDDDGDEYSILIERINNEYKITNKENEIKIIKSAFPSVHWHPYEIKANTIINLLTGDTVDITASKIDNNTWFLDGKIKYYISFDESGRWTGLKFKPDEDSIMEYICNC